VIFIAGPSKKFDLSTNSLHSAASIVDERLMNLVTVVTPPGAGTNHTERSDFPAT
jgi:hypothetical protein